MASTITITCPHCDKQARVSEEMLGKKMRCKGCEKVFAVREDEEGEEEAPPKKKKAPPKKAEATTKKPASAPAPAAKAGEDEEENSNPYGVTDAYLGARCPECANAMAEGDVLCLKCGYSTRTRTRARTRKVREQTGSDVFLWLLPGILCVIGIIVLLVIDLVYCLKIDDWIDPDAWYWFIASKGIKIWLVVASAFGWFLLGRFAVKRLILNPKPPEIEEKLEK